MNRAQLHRYLKVFLEEHIDSSNSSARVFAFGGLFPLAPFLECAISDRAPGFSTREEYC